MLGNGVPRIDAQRVRRVLASLWKREMPNSVYAPRLIPVRLPGGRMVRALAFIADPAHRQFVGELDLHGRARLVAQGIGERGPCVDYIRNTLEHMLALGVNDPHLARILDAALGFTPEMAAMTPPLWPARLHHLRRDSPQPERLARFYGELLGDRVEPLPDGELAGAGPRPAPGGRPGRRRLGALLRPADARRRAPRRVRAEAGSGRAQEPSPSPLFARAPSRSPTRTAGAWSSAIPLQESENDDGCRPAAAFRLRHRAPAGDARVLPRHLGASNPTACWKAEDIAAVFLRSDPEHHSFATFRAPESRADHHCYETGGWIDIRDWGDRMASLRIPLWWGPGRHGPGNNLFFMIEDPDGHKVEFSAELELMTQETPLRTWPHEQRTLNLWGSAWMRSCLSAPALLEQGALRSKVQAHELRRRRTARRRQRHAVLQKIARPDRRRPGPRQSIQAR